MTEKGSDAPAADSGLPGTGGGVRPLRRFLRRVMLWGGRVAAGVSLLAVLLLGILQFDGVSTWIVAGAAARFNPYPGTHLTVGRVSGSWVRSLRVEGVRLTPIRGRGGSGPEAVLESLDVRFRLLPLLLGRVEIREAEVTGLRAGLTQRPDSTWDFLAPFQGKEESTGAGDEEGRIRFRSGPIRIQGATAELAFPPGSSSLPPDRLEVEELSLVLGGLELGDDGLVAGFDTLFARFLPPGEVLDRVFVEGKGSVAGGRVVIPGLILRSGASDVSAAGTLLLPRGEEGEVEDLDFLFQANSLAFRDLYGFVRTLDPAVTAEGELRLQGRASRIEVSGRGTFSDGGQVGLEGTLTPSTAGAVAYHIRGTSRDLRLESFLGEGRVGGSLDALFSTEVEGSDLAHLEGDVSVHVEGLRLNGRQTRPFLVSGGFRDGQADLEVEGGVDELGSVEFSLGGRPLDAVPTLVVQGTYRDNRTVAGPTTVSPEQGTPGLPGQAGVRGLESAFALETKGFSIDSAVGELRVTTLHGDFRGLSLAGGTLRARWTGGAGVFEFDQPIGAGRLAAAGEGEWGKEAGAGGEEGRVLRYSVSELELREVDVSRLLGDTLSSRVNGRLTMEGAGGEPRTLRADAVLRLGESDFRGIGLDSALARPSLRDGALSAVAEAWMSNPSDRSLIPAEAEEPEAASGGWAMADVQGRPFDPEPTLILEFLEFSGIDLAPFAGLPSDLNGLASARMEGLNPRTGKLSGDLRLLPSRIRGTPVDSAEVAIALSQGELRLSGRLSSPSGTVRMGGGASPFADPLEFSVDEGEIRGLDLGSLLGREGLESEVNLDLELHGSGASFKDLNAAGTVVLHPSTLNEGDIRGGSLALETWGGQGTAEGRVQTGEGEVTLRAFASLAPEVEDFRFESDVNVPDLGGFLSREEAELEARGTMAVAWTAGNGLTFASDLEGRIGEAAIDTLSVSGSLDRSVLQLDTLRVKSDLLRATGGGRMALQEDPERAGVWDLRMTADILDLSPLANLVGLEELSTESGRGELHISGTSEAPVMAASLELGPWAVKGFSGDSARVRASRDSAGIALEMRLRAPSERGSIDLALRSDPGSEEKRGTLERLVISAPQTLWALEAQVPFSWENGLRLDRLALASDKGRIAVDGSVDPRGDQDLTVRFERASLAGVSRLLGLEDLDLSAHGEMTLTGPAGSPAVEGELRLDLAVSEGDSASADARFSLAEGQLALDVQALDPAGDPLTLEGTLPLAFSLAPEETMPSPMASDSPGSSPSGGGLVDLTLQSQAFDISWVRALVPGGTIADLAGSLSAAARATGPFAQPVLEGQIGLEDGRVRFPALGTTYEDISFSAQLEGQGIRIDQAHLTSGPGTAEVGGFISLQNLRPQELDLNARTDRFLAVKTPTVSAMASGDLSLRGSFQEPRLEGNLNLDGSEIGLDQVSLGSGVQAVELTEEDYRMLEEYFGYRIEEGEGKPSDFVERLDLDLVLKADQDTWVRRSGEPRIALEVRGDLELHKEPMGEYRAIGTIETLPERSYFRQFGRRFAVQEGELTLTGDSTEFILHISSQWEVPSRSNPDQAEVVVNLDVDGDAQALELTLSSEPAMDEADIVSYLATGEPQGALAESGAAASGLGTSMAAGAMAGVLEGLASEAVELDVVEVQFDPVQGTTLVAGRYVSPNLYLGFRQPVIPIEDTQRPQNQSYEGEVELEYRWFRWLTMNIRGGAGELGLFLRARYAH